jgi:hypothetical protein
MNTDINIIGKAMEMLTFCDKAAILSTSIAAIANGTMLVTTPLVADYATGRLMIAIIGKLLNHRKVNESLPQNSDSDKETNNGADATSKPSQIFLSAVLTSLSIYAIYKALHSNNLSGVYWGIGAAASSLDIGLLAIFGGIVTQILNSSTQPQGQAQSENTEQQPAAPVQPQPAVAQD